MKNIFGFILILLLNSTYGFSQFLDSSKPFDRIELYYNNNNDLELLLTLKVQEDTTLFQPSTFNVVSVKNTYYPINTDTNPTQVEESSFSSGRKSDREIKITLDDHRPFGRKLGESTRDWSKAEFIISYKLSQDDILRESTTLIVYPVLKRIDQTKPNPSLELFRINSQNNSEVDLELSFDPIPEHPIVNLKAEAKEANGNIMLSNQGEAIKITRNKYRLKLASGSTISPGRYDLKIEYNLQGGSEVNEISSLISNPEPLTKIVKVEFVNGNQFSPINNQIINITENRIYKIRVTFNREVSGVGLQYGPKLATSAIPILPSRDISNFHEFDLDFQNAIINDGIYELTFQVLLDGKNIINNNTKYTLNKNTKRIVKFIKYENTQGDNINFTYKLDDRADINKNLQIVVNGRPSSVLSTSSPDRLEFFQSIPINSIQSLLQPNENSKFISFDITYNNSTIFTFETLVLSQRKVKELNTAVQAAIEEISSASSSSNRNQLVDLARDRVNQVLNTPDGKLDEEVENISNFVVDLVKRGNLRRKSFQEIAGSVGKFALRTLKAIILP